MDYFNNSVICDLIEKVCNFFFYRGNNLQNNGSLYVSDALLCHILLCLKLALLTENLTLK